MAIDPAALLFGTYRRQVLSLLFGQPGLGLHVREIARRTGVPPGSLHRELRVLAEAGVLERTPAAGQVRYRANARGRLFEPLLAMFGEPPMRIAEPAADYGATTPRRARVLARLNVPDRVLSALARRYGLKRMAFFGSVTRDDFKPQSDVDVLVDFEGPRTNPFAKLDLADELSALFGGRKVDVVTSGALRNPVRRASIERDLVAVHGA
jgi:predicted nucleotidyltransferase/DNA-binding HxlR family transcriptional regulator